MRTLISIIAFLLPFSLGGDVTVTVGRGVASGVTINDNFDSYANASTLEGQANWDAVGSGDSILLDKPASDAEGRSDTASDNVCIRHLTAVNANHYAQVVLEVAATDFGTMGAAVRCQSGADTWYGTYYNAGNDTLYLFQVSAGSWTELASTSKTYADGTGLRLECTGAGTAARLTVKENTGGGFVVVGGMDTINPSVDIDGGFVGVCGFADSSSTSLHIDDFQGGDL